MGVIGILSLAVGAASTLNQIKQGKRIEEAQKESQEIQGANQQIKNRAARREQIKRARIMRAQQAQASRTTGVSDSSGELGAASALQSSLGGSFGMQRTEERAAVGIGNQNKTIANAQTSIARTQALTQLFGQAVQMAEDDTNLFKGE